MALTAEQEKKFKFRARLEEEQAAAPEAEDTRSMGGKVVDAAKQFAAGFHEKNLQVGYGLSELLGVDVDDNSKKFMGELRVEADKSGFGTAGNVAAEVGHLALPAKGVTSAAKYLPKALQTGKAILAGDVALNTAYGGAKLPEEGQTRTSNAIREGEFALGGGVLGGVLRKSVQGITRTGAANELIEQGVKLTPAQASESVFPKAIEYIGQITPFVARGVRNAKNRATDSWNKVLLNKVSPLGKKIVKAGSEGIGELKNQFNDAYTQAWGKATKPSNEALVDIVNTASSARDELGGGSGMVLKGILADVKNLSKAKDAGPVLKQLDNTLRKKISSAAKQGDEALETTLQSLRTKLRVGAGDDVIEALKPIDAKYGEFVAVRDAGSAKAVMEAGGRIEPTQLMAGVKSAAGKTRAATGAGPLQDFAKQGVDTIGQKSPNPIIDILKGLSVNTPPLVPLQAIGATALGRTLPQRMAQVPYRSAAAQALRDYGVRGGMLGGKLLKAQEEE